MPAQTTSEDRTDSSDSTRAMLREAIREALADQGLPAGRALAPAAPAAAPCSCQHHATPAASSHQVAEMNATLRRGFRASPVLTAGGLVVGVVAVLGVATAALLAVAVTALALAVVAVVLVLVVKMLRKELGR